MKRNNYALLSEYNYFEYIIYSFEPTIRYLFL